jgi:hypothetical protein
MTGHLAVIAHYAVITYTTIMCNMAVSHDKAIISNGCFPAVAGAPMNSYVFSYGRCCRRSQHTFARLCISDPVALRLYGSGENTAILTNGNAFHNGNIAAYPCAFPNCYVLVNNSERINFYVFGKPGVRMYIRMRMNHSVSA